MERVRDHVEEVMGFINEGKDEVISQLRERRAYDFPSAGALSLCLISLFLMFFIRNLSVVLPTSRLVL